MGPVCRAVIAPVLSVALAGCVNGVLFNSGLYSHTVKPLTMNPNPTEVRESLKQARGHIDQLQYQVISVRVGKTGLGQVAREHGLETIFFADMERWSVVFGLWQREVVHIYGR